MSDRKHIVDSPVIDLMQELTKYKEENTRLADILDKTSGLSALQRGRYIYIYIYIISIVTPCMHIYI